MNNVIQKMANRAYNDVYLKELLYKVEQNYTNVLINRTLKINITELELEHLLRFSDILCRSDRGEHRNLSLKIISLLLELGSVKELEYFKLISANTLVKLGNFPSLQIIPSLEEYLFVEEIKIDYIRKEIFHKSPLGQIFTDEQYKVFEQLKTQDYYSFSGSTSFGKSYIFEAFTKYIIKEYNASNNIAFIVPTKALINQVVYRLKSIIDEPRYKIISLSKIPQIFNKDNNKYIFVFTAERLVSYFMESDNPEIDYLFVDEAHKLLKYKDKRTPLLYHAIDIAKTKSIKIYFASPNIPNAEVF